MARNGSHGIIQDRTLAGKVGLGITLGLCCGLIGCGSARVIQRTQTGGTIELQGDKGKAMEQANQEMASHCGPNNFTITQEGEEAIGTDTYQRQDTQAVDQTSHSGRTTASDQQTTAVQSTRTATAWRVHYQCGGQMAAPPPGAPMGAPPPGAPMGPPPPPAPPADPPPAGY